MEGLNLLPWREHKKKQQKHRFFKILTAVFIVGLLVVLSMHLFFNQKIQQQESINRYLQSEVSGLDLQIAQIKDIKAREDDMTKRLQLIYKLEASRPLIVNVFDSLGKIIPQAIYISSIKREGDNITLEGSSESNTGVSELMINAEASPWVSNVKLQQIKTDKIGADYSRRFILNLTLLSDKNKFTKDDQ